MENLIGQLGIKVAVSLIAGYILGIVTNAIHYFSWTKKVLNSIDKEINKMSDIVKTIDENTLDTITRIRQPDNWGLGTKETNELLKELIKEVRGLNTSIVRLLTIVERNGFRVQARE